MQINIDNLGEIRDTYTLGDRLGEGSFGYATKAFVKATGAPRAVKTISKKLMKGRFNLLKREVNICKMVDHPNIVKLYECFEDDNHVHLVLELCSSGTLEERIGASGMEEEAAAVAMQQILRGVFYLHKRGICHRDIKSQNILINGSCQNATRLENCLRISDFGLSCTFQNGEVLTGRVGTLTHMAPQVLSKRYDKACDIWSCGVTMYQLLSSEFPFDGATKSKIHAKVIDGRVSFGRVWVDRSSECMDLIHRLLTYDPRKRCTSLEALNHTWMKKLLPTVKQRSLSQTILENLRGYRSLNKFKRATLAIIASMLNDSQISPARDAFLQLDADGDGFISIVELREKLVEQNQTNIKKNKTQKIQDVASTVDGIFLGSISDPLWTRTVSNERRRTSFKEDGELRDFTYTEFLAATFDRDRFIDDGVCRVAFGCFDKDGDGVLSKQELTSGRLLGRLFPEEMDQLLSELDMNGDGLIDFSEFWNMMHARNGWKRCFSPETRWLKQKS